MPALSRSRSTVQSLALLRYAVLRDLEEKPYGIDSTGLGAGGQTDLRFIFPRTSRLAAITNASRVAGRIFDGRIRDLGFYHLFRLPTYWEARIHSVFKEADTLASAESSGVPEILGEITGDQADPAKSEEGAMNLACLDLDAAKDIKKLANVHANAIAAGKLVVPYFTLKA